MILTTFDLDEYVHEALRAGASGFLLKDTLPVDLLHAVRVVAAGDALIAPRITRRLIEEFARRPGPAAASTASAGLDQLTEREREVLGLVAKGQSNAEIAAALYVSHATVKTHVSRLLMKLDARDRAQLVMVAYETGVVVPRRQLTVGFCPVISRGGPTWSGVLGGIRCNLVLRRLPPAEREQLSEESDRPLPGVALVGDTPRVCGRCAP